MSAKIESVERKLKRGGRGSNAAVLETLAQESFDILSLLPTYIENTKDAITTLGKETDVRTAERTTDQSGKCSTSFSLLDEASDC